MFRLLDSGEPLYGSSSNPALSALDGTLDFPNARDIDMPLNNAAAEKIREYHAA